MKIFKKLFLSSLLITSLTAVQAAELTVGTISGPETDVMEVAVQVAKEEYNLDVKIIEFDDFVTPNIALADGQLDMNAFQHKPYLDAMNKDRGFDLVSVGSTFVYPIGAYSKKLKSIDELQDGATIAVPNDPSNGGRAYLMLHKEGLITLKDPDNLESSSLDVKENPHNFVFNEVDAAQLPRVLDEVDLAFINNTFAVPAGLIATKDALLVEDKDSPYTNLIAVRKGDENREDIKNFVKAYQSEKVKAKNLEVFKGSSLAGW